MCSNAWTLLFLCIFHLTALSSDGGEPNVWRASEVVTKVSQFRTLPIQDFLRKCSFHLTGVVTFVDTNRNMLVLQDSTGAIALHSIEALAPLKPGQLVSADGTNCSPYLANFPKYPYEPSGQDIRDSFEAPSNWGNYHLTRMRGYLRPPTTGSYTFWIASDNSSELWLSSDDDPGKVRRIAFVRQWVDPHEWMREPAQRSETIFLEAGHSYYIEAFQEQLTQDEHLSVAWAGPGFEQSIIDGRHLTPWIDDADRLSADTNGILREFWTNYTAGYLVGVCGPKPFDSALSVDKMQLTVLGQGTFPEPLGIFPGEPLPAEARYRWVEVEGTVNFAGHTGDSATLEITDGQGQAQVQVSGWKGDWPANIQDWLVRARGVCEWARGANDALTAGLVWTYGNENLQFIKPATTNWDSLKRAAFTSVAPTNSNSALGGFYITYGVVTFNHRVFGKDCLFLQGTTMPMFISQEEKQWAHELRVGNGVEIGGDVLPGKNIPSLRPLALRILDEWHSMPEPLEISSPGNKEGRWTEMEGVVRSVNPDGTLLLSGRKEFISAWIGDMPKEALSHYVDSTLRVRGVLSMTLFDKALLLVPSQKFVEMETAPPVDPFALPTRSIASLADLGTDDSLPHRLKTTGVVIYKNQRTLFVQDSQAGARVQTAESVPVDVGDSVELVGFPEKNTAIPTLTEALLRPVENQQLPAPPILDLSDIVAGGHSGTLINIRATLLDQKLRGAYHVLELQQEQRVFEALLAPNQGDFPQFAPGSRLRITGVCDTDPVALSGGEKPAAGDASVGTLRIWLRTPADATLLSGPPWWTWKRAATLVGTLLTILLAAMLWIHYLRRRLERQQAAQLAFSRQILQSQESERRRIAANLHDSLGQNLLVIKNQARLAMQPGKEDSMLQQRLDEISGMALHAIEEIRQITHGLRPFQLDRLGLTQAIRAAINRVSENSPILFATDVEDVDELFDEESEIHLYRIVQESLNNIVKHSNATEATVVLKKHRNTVSLSIRDNGRGFDTTILSSGSHNSGFGLSGISERSRILGGSMTIDSQPGSGTSLKIEIPVLQTK